MKKNAHTAAALEHIRIARKYLQDARRDACTQEACELAIELEAELERLLSR